MDTPVYSIEDIIQKDGFIIITDTQPYKIVTRRSILRTCHILLGDCIDHLPFISHETSLETIDSLMDHHLSDVLPVCNSDTFSGVVLRKDVMNALFHNRINQLKSNYETKEKNDFMDLSQTVHNNIGQYLSALSLRCAELSQKIKLQRLISSDDVNGIHNLCISAVESLHELTKPVLYLSTDNSQYQKAIISICQNIEYLFHFKIITNFACSYLPQNVSDQNHILKFVQEALTNAAKHSGQKSANLFVRCNKKHLIYTVTDNGCGFDISTSKKSTGIKLMEYNAKELSAVFCIKSNQNGTEVTLKIPLNK